MKNHETAVLRFAKHPRSPLPTTAPERDLRMSKVKQKVSGCFRTPKYAEAYCRISSYLQSMVNQGYNFAGSHSDRSPPDVPLKIWVSSYEVTLSIY